MQWINRIKSAQEKEKKKSKPCFTPEDKVLSVLWTTDPFSEFVDMVELRTGNAAEGPKDIYLILDGIYFTKGVETDDVGLAENCYKNIKERVFKLSGKEYHEKDERRDS